jgi:hypothetical protein
MPERSRRQLKFNARFVTQHGANYEKASNYEKPARTSGVNSVTAFAKYDLPDVTGDLIRVVAVARFRGARRPRSSLGETKLAMDALAEASLNRLIVRLRKARLKDSTCSVRRHCAAP